MACGTTGAARAFYVLVWKGNGVISMNKALVIGVLLLAMFGFLGVGVAVADSTEDDVGGLDPVSGGNVTPSGVIGDCAPSDPQCD